MLRIGKTLFKKEIFFEQKTVDFIGGIRMILNIKTL